MTSRSIRNLLGSLDNVYLDLEKTHLEDKLFLLLVTARLIASLPELDLWDGASSQNAKNNSISPQPGRHRAQ